MRRAHLFPVLVFVLVSAWFGPAAAQTVDGEQRKWHPIALTFDGPQVSETEPSTFRDYRMTVTFTHSSGATYAVPGYFAADGDAANSGATEGDKWRVHFTPDRTGTWAWEASFVTGTDAAVEPAVGTPIGFDGESGTLTIDETDKSAPDHRARGMLRYTGGRYLQFDDGTPFIKGGADSPETLLAYADFDDTPATHNYAPHAGDFNTGDPTWGADERGKNLIGGLNYLASKGMVAFSFLSMNVGGDGDDVWPWTAADERTTYDVSKLAQWEIVFTHADHLGLFKHFKTQETENDQLLDGGDLGIERKLYYRELVARFAHHHALNWNLGEEWDVYQELNDPDLGRLQGYAEYFHELDPYDHPVVAHTYPGQDDNVYGPMLGVPQFEGPSIQLGGMSRNEAYGTVRKWVSESAAASVPWNVSIDEPGNAGVGVSTDDRDGNYNHDAAREVLWVTLMGGGDGVEWYFGYQEPNDDLDCEDWRSRDEVWDFTKYAMEFFSTYVPVLSATQLPAENATDVYVLGAPNLSYVVYMVGGAREDLDLSAANGDFEVKWFNPQSGGALQDGSVTTVTGGAAVSLGDPPAMTNQNWVALVQKADANVPHALTVTGGQGDGSYVAGARIAVTADEGTFTGWTGDIDLLEDASSPATYLTMGTTDAAVVAMFSGTPPGDMGSDSDMGGGDVGVVSSDMGPNGTGDVGSQPTDMAGEPPSNGGTSSNEDDGCGCASNGAQPSGALWLLAFVAFIRRRR